MSKIISSLCLSLTVLFFSATICSASYSDESKTLKESLEKLDKKILNDIKSSYKLNTEGFEQLSEIELALLTRRDSTLYDLLEITDNFRKKDCIGSPFIYLQAQRAYILVKSKENKNILMDLQKVNGNHWKVVTYRKK